MGRIFDPVPCLECLILNLALLVGCLLKEASDPNIDCLQLPLFNPVNLCQPSSTLHVTEKEKKKKSQLSELTKGVLRKSGVKKKNKKKNKG